MGSLTLEVRIGSLRGASETPAHGTRGGAAVGCGEERLRSPSTSRARGRRGREQVEGFRAQLLAVQLGRRRTTEAAAHELGQATMVAVAGRRENGKKS
jgi:hypothetical protein